MEAVMRDENKQTNKLWCVTDLEQQTGTLSAWAEFLPPNELNCTSEERTYQLGYWTSEERRDQLD
ncbi:hypothetical protein CRUP_001623 [Coryphaenoides rupestris]|nr:hypothetical protein CRUP_001623 [Coryphaenoides rupestris]